MPAVTPMLGGGGMYIHWIAPWDAARSVYTTGTPNAVQPTVMTGHQCIQGTLGYDVSGCEHFGIATTCNPTMTIYRWLVADPANPGQVKPSGSLVAIAAPVWNILPPAQPAEAPVVVAEIQAPIPVPVNAAPAAGAVWKGWTGGGCSGLALSCTVKMAVDTIVTANFR
ncbi:MAG TPA: hypothetical protein VGK29_09590 [Paludibaculum sp.]|jgi:hypothetical protein